MSEGVFVSVGRREGEMTSEEEEEDDESDDDDADDDVSSVVVVRGFRTTIGKGAGEGDMAMNDVPEEEECVDAAAAADEDDSDC